MEPRDPHTTDNDGAEERSYPDSPPAPPFSPITPVMSNDLPLQQSIEHQDPPRSQGMPNLPLEPFSESENPDAIALRAAISVLEIQRQQSLRDMVTLERQKRLATADPEAFSKAVAARKIQTQSSTVGDGTSPFALPALAGTEDEVQESTEAQTEQCDESKESKSSCFGEIPGRQNVVRCPPINWAKYHVLGQPLDIMHEEQRKRPINDGSLDSGPQTRGDPHIIAAPYDPWNDKIGPSSSV
ncbi:MAG: hypothetical protein Q9220_001732 [cf. Caloplaca sp. 1 TL-2023]